MESTIELSVLKKEIHFVKKDSLTTGQQRNSMKISFNGKEWNGLTKYGVFKVEDTVKDVLITNSDIEIPAEVCTLDNLGKVVYFGIKGTYTETIDGTETETVYTTPYFRLGILERGTETSGNIPEYPTQNAIDAAIENARRWAIGPSSIDKDPTDTNNAKYWSGQAEKFANILSEAGNNESERIKAEKERQNNENIRQSNEAAREVWENYKQDKTYYKGNKISFNGNSYVCVVESTTNQPGQSKDWLLIAQKGDGLIIKDKYTTIEELRIANPNHTYIYQVEQPNGEFYIYSDIASDWISIGTIQGPKGETGEKGDKGDQGIRGEKGEKGDTGASNILTIGSVTSGSAPAVTITGDSPNQVLNFVLEKGDKGEQGEPGTRGEKGDKGDKGEKGNAFTYADFTPDQLAALKGEKGDTGLQGEPGPPGKDGVTPEIVEGELVEVPSAGVGTDTSLGITGATVGQIAKITAVDTNGKPTEWEAVDMPSGGGGETWEKIAEIELRADTAEYVLADFATWRKAKVIMTRSQYIRGLNKNVWCKVVGQNDTYSCGYLTIGYGYIFWEYSAEVNDLFIISSHIETNNRKSAESVISTGTFMPLASPVETYKFKLMFVDTSVIQAGDKVTVIGVRR